MIVVRARHPGLWTAVGAGAGTAIGTVLGNSPIGLVLGTVVGILCAMFTARDNPFSAFSSPGVASWRRRYFAAATSR